MKWHDLKECWYYCWLRLEEWLKATQTSSHYQAIMDKLSFLGGIIGRLYFENLYLRQKNKLLKKLNRQAGQYEDTAQTKLKAGGLLLSMLLLTWWTKRMLLVDVVAIVGYLYYQHRQYLKDPATTAVGLSIDQLQRLTLKQEFYQFPTIVLKNLMELYGFLRVSNQQILFDNFIASETVQRIDEPGFNGSVIFAITSRYPNIQAVNFEDTMLKHYYILPDAKSRNYILKGWLKLDLIGLLQGYSLAETLELMAKNKLYKLYPEVRKEISRLEGEELHQKREQYVITHKLSAKIWSIWDFFDLKSKQLGFSYWDNNADSIVGNSNYIKIRMRLIGDSTYNDVQKKTRLVAKELRGDVMTAPIASDHGSFWMTFILSEIKSPKTTHVAVIKENANKGYVNLGNSRTGQYLMKIPKNDELTSILVGGQSRSGKSTLTTQLILSLLYLKTDNKYDYSDVYICTIKDEDYIVNGFEGAGMLVKSKPAEIYDMLKYVDEQATKRKGLFIERGVKNIKEFNQQYPNEYLGKILVVFDEYANTLAASESEQVEVGGKKVKQRVAIEQLMVKIGQEHGSRGVSFIITTQQFSKGEIGRASDVINIQILGYAQPNVWNSIDNTQEMAKYLQSKSDQRRGLFFINAPDLPVKKPQVTFNCGFTEIRTANIETEEVRQNFDRHFQTSSNYYANQGINVDTQQSYLKPIKLDGLKL